MSETPLEKAHRVLKAKREAGEKIERLDPIQKAHANPKSLRLAINGKCWDCANEQREEIKKCPMTDCTLYPLRPYK